MTLPRSGNAVILPGFNDCDGEQCKHGPGGKQEGCTSLHRAVCAHSAAAQPSQLSGPHWYSLAAPPTHLCLTTSSLRWLSPVSPFCSGP